MIDEFAQKIVPLAARLCDCGENEACPQDCARFIEVRERTNKYLQEMLGDLAGVE